MRHAIRGQAAVHGVAVVAAVAIVFLSAVCWASADVIVSGPVLNATLKKMERLAQEMETGSEAGRSDALYRLGVESDALATLLTDEVEAHGQEQQGLIKIAMERTGQMGIRIEFDERKGRFLYDCRAFERYLATSPRGRYAADAEFKLLEKTFFESSGTDVGKLQSAISASRRFLGRHPRFARNAEVHLFLAMDHRDLYRHYRDRGEDEGKRRHEKLTRQELRAVIERFVGTEHAKSAAELLRRFEQEAQSERAGSAR